MSKELPPELVAIIREFSRPLLRYPREYHEAIRAMGIRQWDRLKEKLSSQDAERVIVYVRAYLEAQRIEQQAEQTFKNGGCEDLWREAFQFKIKQYLDLWRDL